MFSLATPSTDVSGPWRGEHLPVEQALGFAFGLTPSDLPLFSLHPNGSLWHGVVGRFG